MHSVRAGKDGLAGRQTQAAGAEQADLKPAHENELNTLATK